MKRTSVPSADETSPASASSVSTTEEPSNETSSNLKLSQSVSTPQVLAEDSSLLPIARSSSASSSKPTSTKPPVWSDVSAMCELINGLFPRGEILHSFYHCTESKCNYQKEKGKKKFDHA